MAPLRLGRQARALRGRLARLVRGGRWTTPPADEVVPTMSPRPAITAEFADGPLRGGTLDVAVVEGRPPKTIDVPGERDNFYRYGLAEWVQPGGFAVYTFLYRL